MFNNLIFNEMGIRTTFVTSSNRGGRRSASVSSGGAVGDKAYPLSEMTNKEVLAYMKQKRLPMPVRYSDKPSGGVGFNPECFRWMKENSLGDLEKVLKAFPLSEKILIDNKI